MAKSFKQVSKEEFATWLNAYPRKLTHNCVGYVEPPMHTYNDFTTGDWPESIVAKMKEGYYSKDDREYFVLEQPLPDSPSL